MQKIRKIHGTSCQVTFDCEEYVIRGSGELIARTGKIDGFAVSVGSLKYEDGSWLTSEDIQELIERYQEYEQEHNTDWHLEFDE